MNFHTAEFTIQSNWLRTSGGVYLRAEEMDDPGDKRLAVSPGGLERIISQRREMFEQHIETYYLDMLKKNEGKGLTIGRPSIWLAQLGTQIESEGRGSKVFSEKGYNNGGIIKDIDELNGPYHAYWRAVLDGGEGVFNPEVRRVSGRALGGAWLLLELDESKLETA